MGISNYYNSGYYYTEGAEKMENINPAVEESVIDLRDYFLVLKTSGLF